MSINDIIATNSMRAYETGVQEGRKQIREELEALLETEVKDLEEYGRTGLYGIYKALYIIRRDSK